MRCCLSPPVCPPRGPRKTCFSSPIPLENPRPLPNPRPMGLSGLSYYPPKIISKKGPQQISIVVPKVLQKDTIIDSDMISGGSRKGSWKPSRRKTPKTKIRTLYAMFHARRTPLKNPRFVCDLGTKSEPEMHQKGGPQQMTTKSTEKSNKH